MSSLLQSTNNTRVLPTGTNQYFRSDFPDNLTDEEIQWLLDNNIITIIDLRSDEEIFKKPCCLKEIKGFRYYHLPVTGGGEPPKSLEHLHIVYQQMVDDKMKNIIDTIMNAESKVMYFCTAGKDRTGVVSALILKRLGFSDDIRDAIKGSVFEPEDKGFISGKSGMEENIKFGVVAGVSHPQVQAAKEDGSSKCWVAQPGQSINYISCHDNLTFWDKLALSNAADSEETRIKMTKLGSAIIMTSQGVAFFQAGEEMLRSKPLETAAGGYDENSYASPDSTNSIKWDNKSNVTDTYEYYKGLIAFRKAHNALRMTTAEDIQNHLSFMTGLDANVVGYTISNHANGDTAEKITVIFNANKNPVNVGLPAGTWDICVNETTAGTASVGTAKGSVSVAGISAMVLIQSDSTVAKADTETQETEADTTNNQNDADTAKKTSGKALFVAMGAVAVLAAAAGIMITKRKK